MRDKADLRYRPLTCLFMLYDDRQKIVVACDGRVMAFAVIVFHVPDIPGPDIAHLAVTCRYANAAGKADEFLADR